MTWFLYSLQPEQAVLIWDFVLQRDGLSVEAVALSVVMGLSNEILAIEAGHKVFGVLRTDNIGAKLDIQRTLERAASIRLKFNSLNVEALSEKSKYYYNVLMSKHHSTYSNYLKAIEKLRNDYYNSTAASS